MEVKSESFDLTSYVYSKNYRIFAQEYILCVSHSIKSKKHSLIYYLISL
jgi:hypothetical protein